MKICIERQGGTIVTLKDLKDVDDRGEIAHIICELESLKQELLEEWEDFE